MTTNFPGKVKSDALDGKVVDAPDIDGEIVTDQIADNAVVRNKLSSGVQESIDDKATAANLGLVDRKVAGLRELAEQNAEKLEALETNTTEVWDAFTDAEVEAGYGFYADSSATDPVSNDEFVNPNLEWTYDAAASIYVWLRVPKGVDPVRIRSELRRGENVAAMHPQDGEVWDPASIRGLTTALMRQYDYFWLVAESSDAPIAIAGQQSDRLGIEIAAQSHDFTIELSDIEQSEAESGDAPVWDGAEWSPRNLVREIGQNTEAIGSVSSLAHDNQDKLDTIALQKVREFATITTPIAQRDGILWFPGTTNSLNLIGWITAGAARINRSGSTVNLYLGIRVPRGDDPANWQIGRRVIGSAGAGTPVAPTGNQWVKVGVESPNIATAHFDFYQLRNADDEAIALPLPNGQEFVVGRATITYEPARNTRDEARLQALEDKASAIGFDDATEWEAVTDPTGATYGRLILVPAGDAVTSYTDGLNATGSNSFGGSYEVAANVDNVAFVWVAPNNLNWSRVKVQVRSSGGRLRLDLILGSLRTAPATVRAATSNIPASPPDHTVLWPAVSDSEPHSLLDLTVGDTITVQALNEEHIPRWDGDLSEKREAFFRVLEAQLSTAHLRALGPYLGEYQWPDYRESNQTEVISPRDRTQAPPGDLEGVAVDPTTGIAYITTRVTDGTGYLATVDLATGDVERVGNVADYGAATAFNADTRLEMYGIAIDEEGHAWVTFFADDTSDPAPNSDVITAEVWRINLRTGALMTRRHRQVLTSGVQTWRTIAVDDENIYVTRTHESRDMFVMPKTGGSNPVKANAGALTDGSRVQSIAYSPLWMELVALTADHRIRVWNPTATQFQAVTPAFGAGIERDTDQYTIFFSRPGSLIDQIIALNDRSPVLIGTTNTLPTSAGTLTPSVDINLIWVASGDLGVAIGGDQTHPARELRIPKVLPERFTMLRVELLVGDDVKHRFTIPLGGSSDDANDVHTVHDIYVSNNQRLETNMEHYRNQSYDGLRITGTGTSLPANTTIKVFAI